MNEFDAAKDIVSTLQSHGHQAVFAGGAVRDMIMGFQPHDIDIATSATPDQVESLFSRTVAVGKQFGVIVVLSNDHEFEVATFRTDSKGSDGRRPNSINFATMEEDAQRRDLTINGMFMDPNTGEIFDFVCGRDDIKNGVIRLIGSSDRRIEEDFLRMLRVIRFSVKFNFLIDNDTASAVFWNSHKILNVSQERIRDELVKMFRINAPLALNGLLSSGLLDHVLPEVKAFVDTDQNPVWHSEGNVFNHTSLVLGNLPKDASDELIWGALLHDVGKPATTKMVDGILKSKGHASVGADIASTILRRLKFSNDFIVTVVNLVADHMKMHDVHEMKKSSLRRIIGSDHFENLMLLHKADASGSFGPGMVPFISDWERTKKVVDRVMDDLANEPVLPEPLVTGRDLIDLGMKPGPVFKVVLDRVVEEQLEGTLKTRQEALDFVKNNLRR